MKFIKRRPNRNTNGTPTTRNTVRFESHLLKRRPSECLGCGENTLCFSASYKMFTKPAQSIGWENIGPERTLSGHLAPEPVNSPLRITLESNEEFRPYAGAEKTFDKATGGEEGPHVQPSLPPKSLI